MNDRAVNTINKMFYFNSVIELFVHLLLVKILLDFKTNYL